MSSKLRVRQKIGKYRIERRLGEGGFASVYQAMDTIQGIRVALKVPHSEYVSQEVLSDFRKEVRTLSRLEHRNILPIKDASIIDDRFVIVTPLGKKTLEERLCSRMSFSTALDLGEQLLEAVAYAHDRRIVHCDIKPENVLMFDDGTLRLGDFGIAKVAQKTLRGCGTGTVGYMAPEQAMGKPSYRSDVFSVGLLMYRMLAGEWPEYPYHWPPPNIQRLRARAHPDLVAFLRKAIEPDSRKRFSDARQMLNAFTRLKLKAIRHAKRKRSAG
ncbi:MAG: serine/threonine protein kinase [Planctomycetales bacterium]|nr:serine/threonine protein kinase [Planctomycetales bacterium]